jgi:hypothetical protein
VIGDYFSGAEKILEIGSGTGQHAVYFADKLPHLYWQTTDQQQYHEGINLWLDEYPKHNIGRPLILDVTQSDWGVESTNGVYSANTCHIMSWQMVQKMFAGVGQILLSDGYFCLYGPFNYHGNYSSDSNQSFDHWLRERDPESGLREFDELEALAASHGMYFIKRYDLPANNNILVWQKAQDV